MVPHAGMNGELTSPGAAYASLHNMSPQMSAAAAAAAVVAYGRSPMVGDLGSVVGPGGSSHKAETKIQCPHCACLHRVRFHPHVAPFSDMEARRFLLYFLCGSKSV